jgi:WD40 repeat protein
MRAARILVLWLILSGPAWAQPEPPAPGPDRGIDINAIDPGRIRLMLDTGGHIALPRMLTFSPDGKKLVSTGDDRTVQVWDVLTRERLRVFRLPRGADGRGGLAPAMGNRFVFDRASERVAFGGTAKDSAGKEIVTTYVCSLTTGETRTLRGSGPCDYSPDGKLLALGDHGDVRLVEIDTGRTRHIINLVPATSKNRVVSLAHSPDGKTLAVLAESAKVYLFDAVTLARKKPLTVAGIDNLRSVSWADDKTLLCRTFTWQTKHLIVVDAATGAIKHAYGAEFLQSHLPPGKDNRVFEIGAVTGTTQAFVRTENWGAKGDRNSTSFVLDWSTGQALPAYTYHSWYGCLATAIAPDGRLAAQGDANGNDILLWDPQTGKPMRAGKQVLRLRPTVRGSSGEGHTIRWLPDGKGFLWEQLPGFSGEWGGRYQMDVTTLTWKHVDDSTYHKVSHANAVRIPGSARPSDWSKKYHLFPRGIRHTWENLHFQDSGRTVVGQAEPITFKEMRNPCGYDVTFVEGGRVASHPWGDNLTEIFDSATGKRLFSQRLTKALILSWAVSPQPADRYLLIGSADQTLTIYNTATGKVLLTIFPTRQDWIVWTPEGYYAATPGGERLMGWQVENDPDQLASFYPAERFRKRLYRPDVIKLVLKHGSVEAALAEANAQLQKQGLAVPAAVTDKDQLLPPRVRLQSIDASYLPRIKVRASAVAATPSQPVLSLLLLLDGRPLPDGAGRSDNTGAVWDLTLPPGKHTLAVLARSPDTSAVSTPLLFDVAGSVSGQGPLLHVLAIGINQYQQPGLRLNVAAKDASDLSQAFVKHCQGPLFRSVAAKALLDQQATRANIQAELATLRERVQGRRDLAVVYFAGHGITEANRFYLLPVDAKIDQLNKTALSGEELRKALAAFPCQVLLILDACHSVAALKAFRPAVDDVTRTLIDDDVGVAVLCAAMANEEAAEDRTNGLFTRAIVQALGQAPAVPFNRHDRRLYIHHLHSYVRDEVQAASHDSQHPFLCLPSVVDSFALRQLPAR